LEEASVEKLEPLARGGWEFRDILEKIKHGAYAAEFIACQVPQKWSKQGKLTLPVVLVLWKSSE
jgi:hypothetical protein